MELKINSHEAIELAGNIEQLIESARALYDKDMLAACDGNLSYRLNDSCIAITPSGKPKAYLKKDDFAIIDIDGNILSGKPSSEMGLHLAVYRAHPKAKSVIHSHPPCVIGWSIVNPDKDFLPANAIGEVILACGSIPQVPFSLPGSQGLVEEFKKFLPQYRVLILSRHGAVTWGESIEEAQRGTERLEHAAKILKYAKDFGEIVPLPEKEINELKELRKKIGDVIL